MRLRLLGLLVLALSAPAAGQWPPVVKNLQVFPKDTKFSTLIDTMKAFTRALGVRCTYCHVGNESDALDKYDFASDDREPKAKARAMLRMVTAINDQYLPTLPSRRTPTITVSCATCHRGVSQPIPIQRVVLGAYQSGGADSAIAKYRALRTRYYGAAAYDFGEVPLSDVADVLVADGKAADGQKFNQLNAELLPNSGFAFRQLGFGYLALHDTANALTAWQKRLALQPNNPEAKDLVQSLTKKP